MHLFDFDAASGLISNSLVVSNINYFYGVEFSPDGTKLYGAMQPVNGSITPIVYQWDICSNNSVTIIASQYSINLGSYVIGSLQRAINGKIYIDVGASQQFLHVINSPNLSGAAMGYSPMAQSVAPKACFLGLPNFINPYTKPTPAPFTNSIACQTASFAVPPIPTFSSGCSSTPYAPSSYLWDFGEPSSGTANTSTLTNPSHLYASTGTYTATLILVGNCSNDTLKQVVTITTAGPKPDVAGTFTICKGDKFTYTASGGTTYQWFNNATTPTISLAPTTTSVYSVKTTSNGCSLNKSFTVTVNPCTGINELIGNSEQLLVYPNPAKEILNVECLMLNVKSIEISNALGQTVLKIETEEKKSSIDLKHLNEGIYFIQAKGNNQVTVTKRFVVVR